MQDVYRDALAATSGDVDPNGDIVDERREQEARRRTRLTEAITATSRELEAEVLAGLLLALAAVARRKARRGY